MSSGAEFRFEGFIFRFRMCWIVSADFIIDIDHPDLRRESRIVVFILFPKLSQPVGVLSPPWKHFVENLIWGFLVKVSFDPKSLDILLGDFGTDVRQKFILAANPSDLSLSDPMKGAADPVDVCDLVLGDMAVHIVIVLTAAVAGAAVVLAEGTAAELIVGGIHI